VWRIDSDRRDETPIGGPRPSDRRLGQREMSTGRRSGRQGAACLLSAALFRAARFRSGCAGRERTHRLAAFASFAAGDLCKRMGRLDDAHAYLEAARSRPLRAHARLHLGRVLLASGRDRARAVSECRLATGRDPELVAAWFWLGRAIAELVERETAAEASAALRTYLARGAPLGRRSEVMWLLSAMAGKTVPSASA
jgi:tetratricopeptide (TPR) repeat protein